MVFPEYQRENPEDHQGMKHKFLSTNQSTNQIISQLVMNNNIHQKKWNNILKLKEINCEPWILYPAKLSFKGKDGKHVLDKQNIE